ncbi:MAG TPA: DUF4393 domain-containing protein [Candidatus Cloacimonadota bacterium]|nr:DUF4393 domain-containing protein [Candidatus Cloacimonadota bacterium]
MPEDQIIDVPPELGLPILDKFTHVTNEDIRAMYVKLLTSASVQSTMSLAHPSALRIIESLSPDEAKILNHIKAETNYPFITIQHKLGAKRGYRTIDKYLMGIEKDLYLSFPENIPLYIDNLLACGLYHYTPSLYLTDVGIYKKLEEAYSDLIERRRSTLIISGSESQVFIKHEMISKSKLGDRFIKSCCE